MRYFVRGECVVAETLLAETHVYLHESERVDFKR
ncbi:hypothetical protein ETR_08306 [Erwinia tracheiphila PSU-1]|nr:hypothetical protein ETR_08306 [Erwinia tracheiphila PSU-1]